MTKIVDPDNLNQATEITFNTSGNTITLAKAGNLSDDGVTIQCIYSFCKEEWKSDSNLIKHPFPMKAIDGPSGTQFDMIGDWDWGDQTTRELIRDGGWAVKNSSGVSLEEYMNLTSLGSFLESTDKAYYTQGDASAPTDVVLSDVVNQAIKVYGDASHGSIDYRGDFILFLREEAKTYDKYDLLVAQNIAALTYKKYALPLSNASDAIKITHSDAEVALAPYTNIDITYFASDQSKTIGAGSYPFRRIIEGDGKTLEQIYEKVMYQLRQTTDVDEGAGNVRGDTADDLLWFVGDTLHTRKGVFIENIQSVDQNRIVFLDQNEVERVYPYASAGTLSFNAALQNDADAIYRMFFTNNDSGDNDGSDYGTDDAIIVNDNVGSPISGNVGGSSTINFDFDYDGNVQRGAASAGTDAPVTLVAIGLDTAQYVPVSGTIVRTKSNNFSFVANDELTYSNP
jgi:hypothetical protein